MPRFHIIQFLIFTVIAMIWRESRFHLALACLRAGRPRQAINWVEAGLKQEKSRSRIFALRRLGATAFLRLGRLSEHEDHLRRALELALEAEDKKWIADSLASLAELERSRGNLAKAESMCLEAESLLPKNAREAFHVHANVCRSQGRLEEAVEKLMQAGKVGILLSSSAERRMQAIFKLDLARCRVDLGLFDQAGDDLTQAKGVLNRDPRLGAVCEAVNIRLMAIQGAQADTMSRADELLRRLAGPTLGIPEHTLCLVLIGRTFLDVGEHGRAIRCFERVVAETSHPINQPVGYYYLGECRLHAGDLPIAFEHLKQATSFGIDSHHTRLAEQRIRELPLTTSAG